MPIDAGSISALTVSLKTAAEITKAMIGLRDATMIQAKIIELQTVILSAQGAALSAQSDQFSLLERVRELEKEVANMKAWDREKKKYELSEVYPGAFAYTLKPQARGAEPAHWICAACYQHGRKSLLQEGFTRLTLA